MCLYFSQLIEISSKAVENIENSGGIHLIRLLALKLELPIYYVSSVMSRVAVVLLF